MADDKHQEHHPEFAQVAHAIGVLGQRQRIGANQHANRQIPQHGRQFQVAAGHHAEYGGQQVKQRQF
jgi:hypothetical protein